MKSYQALFSAQDEIKELLKQCDFLDGSEVNETDLKATKKIMFWHLFVKHTDASNKPVYITFDVLTVTGFIFGDNKALNYKCSVELKIFTNKDEIRNLITTIDNKSEEFGWSFEMTGSDFDAPSKKFTYSFILEKVVS